MRRVAAGRAPGIPNNRSGRSTWLRRAAAVPREMEKSPVAAFTPGSGRSRRLFAGNEKLPRALTRASFFFATSINSGSDVDRPVGGPPPAAIINVVMTVPIAGGATYQYDASVPHLLSSGLAKLPLWARKLLLKKAIEGSIILLARTRGRWPRDVRAARKP